MHGLDESALGSLKAETRGLQDTTVFIENGET